MSSNERDENDRRYRWAVGENMPGYMPDNAPAYFTGWKAARDYYVERVREAVDNEGDTCERCGCVTTPQNYTGTLRTLETIEKMRKASEQGTCVGDYCIWLHKL